MIIRIICRPSKYTLGCVQQAGVCINKVENEQHKIDFQYKTGNVGVDAILNSKLTLAERSGIRLR